MQDRNITIETRILQDEVVNTEPHTTADKFNNLPFVYLLIIDVCSAVQAKERYIKDTCLIEYVCMYIPCLEDR